MQRVVYPACPSVQTSGAQRSSDPECVSNTPPASTGASQPRHCYCVSGPLASSPRATIVERPPTHTQSLRESEGQRAYARGAHCLGDAEPFGYEKYMQVLVADDNIAVAKFLTRAFSGWHFDVITAKDGNEAWDCLNELTPPFAILDWTMPGVDGIELCRRIRGNPATAQTYVILVTGRQDCADLVAGLEAGANDYVTKPINLPELHARVNAGVRVVEAYAERDRLLDSISSIVIRVNGSGQVTRWNRAAQDIFEIPPGNVVGRTLADCGIAWTDPGLIAALLDHPDTPARLEDVSFMDGTGRRRLLGLTITTMRRSGSETLDGFVVLGAEITARRVMEQQLRHAQKLESIGQLAAGIAHEINTPMQYVGDNIRFLRDAHEGLSGLFESVLRLCRHDGPNGAAFDPASVIEKIVHEARRGDLGYIHEEMPRAIQQSLEGVQHVSRIVKAMKDFSHPGTDTKVAVDLNRAVETTLTVARNELKYVADTVTELDPHLPLVPCLPGEVNQVLLNLLINAAHAIGDALPDREESRGRITVSTKRIDDTVELRVSDTGTGIPDDVRSRIFEPFFTTKSVGRGTGQGLPLAHAVIVKKHGGEILFDTELGKGTTFIVRLPLTTAVVAAVEDPVGSARATLNAIS